MILDPILILVLKQGVRGAAIATIISQAITMLVFLLVYLRTEEKLFRFHIKAFNLGTTKEIARVGLPAGVQSMVFTMISIYIARLVFVSAKMSWPPRGSHPGRATDLDDCGGFQTALTVYIGQNYGAKQYTRVRRGVGAMSGCVDTYSLTVALMLLFLSQGFMSLFIDDPITKAYGVRYLQIISLAQVFMMIEAIGVGFFNGIGRTEIPSAVGILGNLIRIPLAYLLWKV
jgi:Na+-driven multidrug efflux pump